MTVAAPLCVTLVISLALADLLLTARLPAVVPAVLSSAFLARPRARIALVVFWV